MMNPAPQDWCIQNGACNVFARRDVDADVVPLLGWNLRQAALHQRLAGRDDLDDASMACRQIGLDAGNEGGGFHRGEKMAEETLLRALEGRTGGGFGLSWAFMSQRILASLPEGDERAIGAAAMTTVRLT